MPENKNTAAPAVTVTREQFLNLFIAVFLPMFMAAIDQTLLATATPAIALSLGGLRDSSWIMVAYLLSAAVIVPVYGRLGDIRGKRRMLLVALAVFAVGSIACSAAQTMPQLIAARVIHGLGGGGLMMLSHALVGELVPPAERVRFQGWFALMFTTASVAGPIVGGVAVTYVSWRWLFIANIPLVVFAAWRLGKLPPGERHPPARAGMDVAGHVLFAIGTLSTLFWLTSGGHRFEWMSSTSAALSITAVASLAALVMHERRHHAPFLPLDLLAQRAIRFSSYLAIIFAACLFAVIFFLPIYLQLGHRVSPQVSGLLLLPLTAGQVTGNLVCTRILRRTGYPYQIPIIGMGVTTAALLLLGVVYPAMVLVALLGFFVGAGLGTIMPVTMLTVQTVAGRTKLGTATSTLSLARSTGGAAGAALFGAIVFAILPDVDRHTFAQEVAGTASERVLHAFHVAFLCAAGVAALGIAIAVRMPRIKLWEKPG
ncbi:MAG TPA: MFS transporter [Burkholderiales bacterium]|nr:MFS transporter [Burkholderiales bacterium]